MDRNQFESLKALLTVNAQYLAIIAAQGQLQRPLDAEDYDLCAADVRRTVELLESNLEVGVLPPDVWRPPFWRR